MALLAALVALTGLTAATVIVFLRRSPEKRRMRRWSLGRCWDCIHATGDVFHLLPVVAATVIALLFAFVGQLYEIYYSYFDNYDPKPITIVAAIIALSMLSVALHASHYWLSRIRVQQAFDTYHRPVIPIRYRRTRTFLGWLLAFSPWLGLAIGFGLAEYHIVNHYNRLKDAVDLVGGGLEPLSLPLLIWMALVAVLVALTGLIVATVIHFLRRSRVAFWAVSSCALGCVSFAAIVPTLSHDSVSIYRAMGPLATVSITLLALYSLFALLAFFSQGAKYPAFTLVTLLIALAVLFGWPFPQVLLVLTLVFGLLAVLAAIAILREQTELWPNFGLAAMLCVLAFVAYHRDTTVAIWNRDPNMDESRQHAGPPDFSPKDVNGVFRDWVRKRIPDLQSKASAAGDARYPAFIISTEGGGIYAAAAAALFLAKLQDDCPNFANHVFAISGVSGGAIGATIFQSLARSIKRPSLAECAEFSKTGLGPLQQNIYKIMQDDHFSPVVGAVVPDLLGEKMGRALELEASFVSSTAAIDPAAAKDKLENWYISHWSDGNEPALVLNTTSAETGYRVAFAPFYLSKSGNKTLFSLVDADLTEGFAKGERKGQDVPLMFAAVASARFPLILPPFAVTPGQNAASASRWNFVDGGYADNSGTETALDLYASLERDLEDKSREDGIDSDHVDLKVIVLTSDDPLPPFKKIVGTAFSDTVAPVQAVLNVRAGLANQAVTRICEYFKQKTGISATQNGPPSAVAPAVGNDECGNENGNWKIRLMRLQDEAYGLTLGWKISHSHLEVVSQFVSRTDHCKPPDDKKQQDHSRTDEEKHQIRQSATKFAQNSCALGDIELALKPFLENSSKAQPAPLNARSE